MPNLSRDVFDVVVDRLRLADFVETQRGRGHNEPRSTTWGAWTIDLFGVANGALLKIDLTTSQPSQSDPHSPNRLGDSLPGAPFGSSTVIDGIGVWLDDPDGHRIANTPTSAPMLELGIPAPCPP